LNNFRFDREDFGSINLAINIDINIFKLSLIENRVTIHMSYDLEDNVHTFTNIND